MVHVKAVTAGNNCSSDRQFPGAVGIGAFPSLVALTGGAGDSMTVTTKSSKTGVHLRLQRASVADKNGRVCAQRQVQVCCVWQPGCVMVRE